MLPDGSVLIMGGRNDAGVVPIVELFDPLTGAFTTWSMTGSMARAAHATTLVTGGQLLVIGARLAMVAVSLLGIYASIGIARRLAGPSAAIVAGILAAAYPPAIILAPRTLSEMASGPLLALAALLVFDDRRRAGLTAGLLAGLSVFVRYQNGVVVMALWTWLLVQRRSVAAFTSGLASWTCSHPG